MSKTSNPPETQTRPYAGQDSQSRIAQRRARYIEAGVRLFGTLGYHGTSMRVLTNEVGLNVRYFYESFETMEDLLVACYEQVIADYQVRMGQALAKASPDLESQVRASVTCFFQEMRNPHFARITQVEVLGVSPRVDALYIKTIRSFGAVGVQMLSSGGSPKPAQSREFEVIGVALIGAMSTIGAMWVRSHYSDPIETVIEATLKIIKGTSQLLLQPPAAP